MALHGFFAGWFGNDLSAIASQTNVKSAGYRVFGQWGRGSELNYTTGSDEISCIINTPSNSTIGSVNNNALNNAKAGSFAQMNDWGLASTWGAGILGGANGGSAPEEAPEKQFFIAGCIEFSSYNLNAATLGLQLGDGDVDGAYNNGGNPQFTQPGNINAGTDNYAIMLVGGIKQGQSVAGRTASRIHYVVADGALGSTLAKLNYYYSSTAAYGLAVQNSDSDELAAGKWLKNGYGILENKGTEVYWDISG